MSEPLLPPQDLQAEESVLGACLLTPTAIDNACEIVTPADFYRESHGRIFQTILDLHGQGEPADVVTVPARLGEDWRVRIVELAALVPYAGNVAHYARIVKERAQERAVIRISQEWMQKAYRCDVDLDEMEQQVYEIANHAGRDEESVPDVLRHIISNVSHLRQHPREVVGVPTGYPALDRITQGFQPGNLIILAGRPGMAKSAFAICVAGQLAGKRNLPVGFWSLEMSKAEILQRMISIGSQIDVPKIREPWSLSDQDEVRLMEAAARIATIPLELREPAGLKPLELRAQVRRWRARNPDAALVIVDYLQLMTGSRRNENRTTEVSEISRMLKVLAKEMQVPVLALSQLSRAVELRPNKRPILSDLRESGSIEQDADIVLMLYRDDYYNENSDDKGIAEVAVVKNRNGGTGTARLAFIKGQTRFSSLAPSLAPALVDVAA